MVGSTGLSHRQAQASTVLAGLGCEPMCQGDPEQLSRRLPGRGTRPREGLTLDGVYSVTRSEMRVQVTVDDAGCHGPGLLGRGLRPRPVYRDSVAATLACCSNLKAALALKIDPHRAVSRQLEDYK